jgi:hypothetical protein
MKTKLWISLGLVVVALAACTENTNRGTPTAAENTTLPTETMPAPATVTPTETVTPLPTETPTVTLTPTSTTGWNELQVISVWRDANGYGIIFNIPGIDESYNATIDGKPFTCTYEARYPDRLTCLGESFRTEVEIQVIFTGADTGGVVFTTSIIIGEPAFAPTPSYPTGGVPNPNTWCPQRGQNVYCETENRISWDPPCLITSCFDACGYWYSIDTCTPRNSHP